ncbi:hypothetical protein HY638_03135 [Candidatus Woesearchaeota archaeon]|nr:hypothetical protein [Candidatus Woesearchaeota archaeon]
MWPFGIFRKSKKHEIDVKELLRRRAIAKLRKINLGTLKGEKELYNLIRSFFQEFFSMKYEFTYEELQADLKKFRIEEPTRVKLLGHLEGLKEKRFGHEKVSKAELREIRDEFKTILQEL